MLQKSIEKVLEEVSRQVVFRGAIRPGDIWDPLPRWGLWGWVWWGYSKKIEYKGVKVKGACSVM